MKPSGEIEKDLAQAKRTVTGAEKVERMHYCHSFSFYYINNLRVFFLCMCYQTRNAPFIYFC